MRRGGRILIILGLLLGVITAVGTFVVLGTQPTTQAPPMQPVVIAVQSIPARSEIKAEALGTVNWPEPIPVGAFGKVDDVAGKLALQTLYPGQIILPQSLVDKKDLKSVGSNASLLVPDGKVAVAFAFANIAGAVQPGDFVDMLLTLSPSTTPTQTTTTRTTALTGNEGLPVTQLFLQDVLVLQVGPWPAAGAPDQQATSGGAITFALDRQDSLSAMSATEQGTVQLVLRRSGDHKIITTEPVTLQYLNKRFNFNLTPSVNR